MSRETFVIHKVKQLGFSPDIIEEVEKYFSDELNEHEKKEVEPLISFVDSILDETSYALKD
ncbi:MAG TPA: hypothetical protein ENK65_02220 [Helicobacteraceae bacterium]|nr:hypothetical protein [Helicobacteraceae bacterium]